MRGLLLLLSFDMEINEVKVKTIIVKSNLPEADFVINAYTGCSHLCIYCYARFMERFTRSNQPWGRFVNIKINAPDLIPDETDKYHGKSIFMSSVTDPYMLLERKYELTRKILEKLIKLQPNLEILTKSSLVLRDIDLLKQFKHCNVGLTITNLNDDVRKEVEPGTVSVEERITALAELKKAGLKTYVFIGPILPYLTNWQKIVEKVEPYVDSFMFENLTVRGSIWRSISGWLSQKHPDLMNKYQEVFFGHSDYWDKTEKSICEYCKKNKLDFKIFFHHSKGRK